MDQANPYAAPKAALIDGIIFMAAGVGAGLASGGPALASSYSPPLVIALGLVGAINLWTVHRYRASIGKLALKIRMVRSDGAEAELWRIVFLRGLPQWVVSAIPFVNLLNLVDVLFVFGKARRCVHDYIADTIVVKKA
jgi:uncharacterized RDD family membrane protein YckC